MITLKIAFQLCIIGDPDARCQMPDARYQTPVGVKHPIQEATKVGKDLVQDASPLLKSTPDVDDQLSTSSKTILKCAPTFESTKIGGKNHKTFKICWDAGFFSCWRCRYSYWPLNVITQVFL